MVFSSASFLFVFLPITLLLYYVITPKFRNAFLLLVSIVYFVLGGNAKSIIVLILSIVVNWLLAIIVNKFRQKKKLSIFVIVLMVVFNVGLLFVFKYLKFTLGIFSLQLSDSVANNLILPLGISFFTFQAISYVVDVYKGRADVCINPINVGLYIAFFPRIMCGPIVRYSDISKELLDRHENWNDFSKGMVRFIEGLAKKVLLANTFAIVADHYFGVTDAAQLSVAGAWLGSICYSLQIFFDFAGYSDMAIGLGMMFGFHFAENFNYPYISTSVTDFWRRWHISLSRWFRDYVYIPLGGNRCSKPRWAFNMLVVWLLTGIWHGANWTFICWGLFYFVILMIEKLTGVVDKLKNTLTKTLYRIFTLLCVNFAWVLFRADSIDAAIQYIVSMFGGMGNVLYDRQTGFIFLDIIVLFVVAIACCIPWKEKLENHMAKKNATKNVYSVVKAVFLLVLLVVCCTYSINGSYNPFVYLDF